MSKKNKQRVGRAIGAIIEAIESRLLLSTTTFSISDASLVEGDSGSASMVFTVNRTGALDRAMSIVYDTVDGTAREGTDYYARRGVLRFGPGQTTAIIGFPVFGNTLLQGDRSFSVRLEKLDNSLFTDKPTDDLGAECHSIVTGDVNGDGILDLVTGNWSAHTVSVLLGTGDGSFTLSERYDGGAYPISEQLGDFNGDGKLDLAVANDENSTVSIGLGNGDGTFQPRVTYPTGGRPASMRMTDFNGDGNLDLSVSSAADHTVDVLLGNGDGSFQSVHRTLADDSSFGTALADFDGDGKVDIAAVNWFSRTVGILSGHGDGTFGAAVEYPLHETPMAIATADFDGDGKLDLFVNNLWGYYEVLLGKADGTFQQSTSYCSSVPDYGCRELVAGDFDADGKIDIAIGNGSYGFAYLLPGIGDGTFGDPLSLQQDNYVGRALQIAVGDFDRDGLSDLAVAGYTRRLGVFLNNSQIVLPDTPATGTILDDDAPVSLAVVRGDAQATTAGRSLRTAPTLIVKNAGDFGVRGIAVTFAAPSEGPGGTFASGNSVTVLTDAQGLAIAPEFITNAEPGDYTITASVAGLHLAVFALQNLPNAAPTLQNAAVMTRQGQACYFDGAGFEAALSDAEGDSLQCIRITSLPMHGTLSFNGASVVLDQEFPRDSILPVTRTTVGQNGFAQVEVSLPIGRLMYTPDSDFGGDDSFTWNASAASAWAATDATVSLTVVAAVATTVTLDAPATANVNGEQPVVLKAHLTSPDASQVQFSGTVTFLDLSVDDYANALYLSNRSLMPTSPMWLNNPADPNSPIAARVLGTASVNAGNSAELSLKMLMPGARRIVAVFMGDHTPLTARTTGHDAEVTMAADAHEAWVARQRLVQGSYIHLGYSSGSINLPGFIWATTVTGALTSSTTWLTSPTVQPEMLPGISDESVLGVKITTGMTGGVTSGTTLTNLPSLWFQMTGLTGAMGTTPVLPSSGSFHTASAGLLLTLPLPLPDLSSTGSGSVCMMVNGTLGGVTYTGSGSVLTISHPGASYNPEPPLPMPDPAPVPTGSVRMYDGDILLDTVTLNGAFSGIYVPEAGSLALGTHNFRFVYDGDNHFAGFTRQDTVEITHTSTNVFLTKSVDRITQGESVSLAATVSTATPDTVTPTGIVHFLVDGTEVARVVLGAFSPLTLDLSQGRHTITVRYDGDHNCLASTTTASFVVFAPLPQTPPVTSTTPIVSAPSTPPAVPSSTTRPIAKPTTMGVAAKMQGKQLRLTASILDILTRKRIAGTVEWRLDGKRVAVSNSGNLLTLATKLARGLHTLTAVSIPTSGYAGTSKAIKLKATAGGVSIVS